MSKEKTTQQLQAELDDLIASFESDQIDLDVAMSNYKRGKDIIKQLQQRLVDAENTINHIVKE